MNQFLEAALRYSRLGWHIFPLAPGQKVPITKHGVKDATTDANQIRAWWKQWPNANVAVACGPESGVYVIDIDVTEAGDVNGYKSMKEFPPLPITVAQETPRGGSHAFYRASDPPANRNSFRPGIDVRGKGYYVVLAPSVHPNGGVYKWAHGCAPWERKPAEFPEFMRPTIKAPWITKPDQQVPMAPVGPAEPGALQRASAYLAKCDPAIQGQGGHDKLFWAAACMVHKCKLSDSQAYDILSQEYNPRCVPPWDLSIPKDEKEFRRKISEARKNPPAIVTEWEQEEALERGEVSQAVRNGVAGMIDGFHASSIQAIQDGRTELVQASIDRTELKFLISPPGLVGEICDWINKTAMCPQPFLTLACTLTFCGALFGQKVRDHLDTRTNIYCMGVAKSSAGKNHAPSQIRKLCAAVGCIDLLGGDSTASDSAIEERVSLQPAIVFLWDEIGHLLSNVKTSQNPHLKQVVSLFMRLYSSASNVYTGREYADAERRRTVHQPCCCLYGTSTPGRFIEGITPEELQDGWLSRCLVFRVYDLSEKIWEVDAGEIPQSICKQVAAWFTRQVKVTDGHDIGVFVGQQTTGAIVPQSPEQILVPIDAPAEQMFRSFHRESREFGEQHLQLDCLWAKAEENARKVALILAAGKNYDTPRITPEIADYACRLIRYLLLDFGQNTVPAVVTGQIDAKKQKLLKIIEEGKVDGCIKRDVTRRSQWANKKERDALLADMQEAGKIVIDQKVNHNARAVYYWTFENYRKYLEKQTKKI
jgi:hypothetical protein